MPTADDLDDLTNAFLDYMMFQGGDFYGREAEQTEELGSLDERCSTDCVSGENVL